VTAIPSPAEQAGMADRKEHSGQVQATCHESLRDEFFVEEDMVIKIH